MRNLFFALILANLAFAAWQAWFAVEAPVRAPPTAADSSAIQLVAEVGPDDAPSPPRGGRTAQTGGTGAVPALGSRGPGTGTGAGVDPPSLDLAPRIAAPSLGRDSSVAGGAAAPASARCVSVGPFPGPAEADGAAGRLRASGFDPAPRAAEGDVGTSYWVHIDAIPTRAEANGMLSTLRENGVTDAYLIPGEEDGDIISLGVFNDIVRANRLRDRIRPIGFEPLVVDRPRRGTVYWLDVTVAAGRQLELAALQTPGRIMRLEQRPCEAPGA